MATFGKVDTGFNPKPLSQIILDVENRLKASSNFGNNIDTSPESVFGQHIGSFAETSSDIWERMTEVYEQQRLASAVGTALDDIADLRGITRLAATPTVINNQGMAGVNGTIVPAGTQIKNTITLELFELRGDTTITNLQLTQGFVSIDTLADGTLYTLTVGGTPYTFTTAAGGDTVSVVALALVNAIQADGSRVADATDLLNGRIQLDVVTGGSSYDTIVDANMTFFTPSIYDSINTGPILAVANTVNIIETPFTGFNSTNNFLPGTLGRDDETDEELRKRYTESSQIIGAGVLEAIVARFKANTDVDATSVRGFENRTLVVDGEGRPGKSFEIVILSPNNPTNDQFIVDLLWLIKPAGIETFGNTTGNATDSNGNFQAMNFTRPTEILAHVKITYVADPESTFPSDGIDTIKACILEVGNKYDVGENLKPIDFAGCVSEFPGIESAVVEVAIGAAPFVTTVIQIDDNDEIAVFDLTRITVTT